MNWTQKGQKSTFGCLTEEVFGVTTDLSGEAPRASWTNKRTQKER